MPGIYFLFRGVEEMRQHSFSGVTVGEQQPLGQRKGSMAFKDLSATTIAEQLTFLEYRMLRRIPVRITHFLFIFFLGCLFVFFFRNGTLPPGQSFWSRGQKLLRPKWAKCIPVFRPKQRKNPTRWGGTYLYGLMQFCRSQTKKI